MKEWKKKKKQCPFCRTNLTSEHRANVIDECITNVVKFISDKLYAERIQMIEDRKSRYRGINNGEGEQVHSIALINSISLRFRYGNTATSQTSTSWSRRRRCTARSNASTHDRKKSHVRGPTSEYGAVRSSKFCDVSNGVYKNLYIDVQGEY